jgi:hypothetical protein
VEPRRLVRADLRAAEGRVGSAAPPFRGSRQPRAQRPPARAQLLGGGPARRPPVTQRRSHKHDNWFPPAGGAQRAITAMAHRDRRAPGQADNTAGASTPLISDWPPVWRLSIMARRLRHSIARPDI